MPIDFAFRRSVAHLRGASAVGLFALFFLAGCWDVADDQQTPQVPAVRREVSVVTLHPQSVAITAELPGRTAASLVAEVRPQVNGIIQKRLFKEGREVEAGTALYQIDPATYQAAYDSALAALQKAQATVPSAQAKVERYRGLIKRDAISEQDLDDAVATLAQAKADVAAEKASVEAAKINLAYTTITAPISGRVGKSSLTQGALVTANQDTALTTIRKLDPINVDVMQSSTNLLNLIQAVDEGRLKFAGENVRVKLKLENGTIYPHTGKLEFAEANVDESTGTFTLRAEFANPDRLLMPGTYVRAIVEEGVAENSFLVPQRAVNRNTKGEATVLCVAPDGKVEERVLSVQSSVGNSWLVDSGVSDGDRIIVEGTQFVRVGQEVTPVEVTLDETTGEVRERKAGSLSDKHAATVAKRDAGVSLATATN